MTMDAQDQNPAVLNTCDESKCVSTGMSRGPSFTCYGDLDGIFFPMMCADGFVPEVVEDEPPQIVDNGDGSGGIALWYFTCCPPYDLSSNTTDATRHCSDPITAPMGLEGNNGLCSNEGTREYPRQMKTFFFGILGNSFLCCDEDITNTMEANFLEESECVPYNNDRYESYKIQNTFGFVDMIFCESEKGFLYPHQTGEGMSYDVATTGRYQCCKHGPGLPPFVHDSNFHFTVWPIITLDIVSAILSSIVFIGLLIPLTIQLKKGNPKRRTRSGRLSGKDVPQFSTYNMYLIYLAFMDLVVALWNIVLAGGLINQKVSPYFYHMIVAPLKGADLDRSPTAASIVFLFPYACANMALNAIVAYELVFLIKRSQGVQRINPPSLTRVNLQAGIVLFFSLIYGFALYYIWGPMRKAYSTGNFKKAAMLQLAINIPQVVIFSISLAYIIYAMVWIWWHGYLKTMDSGGTRTSMRDRAMRQLVLYFLRIVAVFVFAWVPAQIFNQIYTHDFESKQWALFTTGIFVAIQPAITFFMMLTKPDVQKYIWQLVTLYHCTSKQDGPDRKASATRSYMGQGVSALGYGIKVKDTAGSTRINTGNDATSDNNAEDNVNDISKLGFGANDFHSGDVPEEAVEAETEQGPTVDSNKRPMQPDRLEYWERD